MLIMKQRSSAFDQANRLSQQIHQNTIYKPYMLQVIDRKDSQNVVFYILNTIKKTLHVPFDYRHENCSFIPHLILLILAVYKIVSAHIFHHSAPSVDVARAFDLFETIRRVPWENCSVAYYRLRDNFEKPLIQAPYVKQ